MFNRIKKLFGRKTCYICKNKAVEPRFYFNDDGEKVTVCVKCVPYAERRAMRKA